MKIILFTQEDPFYIVDSTKDLIQKIKKDEKHSLVQENTEPKRIWRFLNENHLNGKIDFTKQYGMDDHKSKIKFGVLTSYQLRNFEIGQ